MKIIRESWVSKYEHLLDKRRKSNGNPQTIKTVLGHNPVVRSVLPRHVVIAMDGNGRWAERRNQARSVGHRSGAKVAFDIILAARQMGVEVLTLYAFSMENWGRDPREVAVILDELLPAALSDNADEFNRLDIRIEVLGEKNLLSERTERVINEVTSATRSNKGLIVNIAVSYSGRLEILKAVRRLIGALEEGEINLADLDEALFTRYLDSGHLPFPDLFIRCGGVNRISNFMLWQMAYTEIVALDVLWPDFKPEHLGEAIRIYQKQPRKFGLVPESS